MDVNRSFRLLACAAALALPAGGCSITRSPDATAALASPSAPRTDAEWRREAEIWGARYNDNPRDATAAMAYARALRATGQRPQAASVLENATLRNPNDMALLGAFGRALADVGKYDQALAVFSRAHSPDRPDWRIVSAQGAVLDQLGRHQEAQRYYASALKIAPDEPSVLSNLGLSYALAKDLGTAESTLRRANARPSADPRVRQNLALVVGLQGRFAEAEDIARADLPPAEAAANVGYLRQMLAQHNDGKKLAKPERPKAPSRTVAQGT